MMLQHLAKADVGLAMNSGTGAAKEVGKYGGSWTLILPI